MELAGDAAGALDAPAQGSIEDRAAAVMARAAGGAGIHLIYAVNIITSYLLMLAAMTFNVGIFASTVAGALWLRL